MFEKIKTFIKKKSTAAEEIDNRIKKDPAVFVEYEIADTLTNPEYNQLNRKTEVLTTKRNALSQEIKVVEATLDPSIDEDYIKMMFRVWLFGVLGNTILNCVVFYSLVGLLGVLIALIISMFPTVVMCYLRNANDKAKAKDGKINARSFYMKVGFVAFILSMLLFVQVGMAIAKVDFIFDGRISKAELDLEQAKSSDAHDQTLILSYQNQYDKAKADKKVATIPFVFIAALTLSCECLGAWHLIDKNRLDKLHKLQKKRIQVERDCQSEVDKQQIMIEIKRNKIIKKLNDLGLFTQAVIEQMGLIRTPIEGEIQETPQQALLTDHDVASGNDHDDAVKDTDESIAEISREVPISETENKNDGFDYDYEFD